MSNMRSRYLTKFHGQKNYDNIEDTEENWLEISLKKQLGRRYILNYIWE